MGKTCSSILKEVGFIYIMVVKIDNLSCLVAYFVTFIYIYIFWFSSIMISVDTFISIGYHMSNQ